MAGLACLEEGEGARETQSYPGFFFHTVQLFAN